MGKRFLTLLCALVLAVSCTGCSLLNREWYEVTAHSSGYYEGRDALRADTYQDLVNDILVLVGNHSEEGVIWLYYAQEGLDADDAAERACREVEEETSMGAYAVSYIQYTVDNSARNYSAITVTIGYRRTAQQVADVVHATNLSALADLLAEAAQAGRSELAVQFSSIDATAQEVMQIVEAVRADQGGRSWTVNFYPESSVEMVEILMG